MTKRIMRAFKMNEISAVDRPAQSPARAAIMKRAVGKGMYDVAEFARVIASIGYLLQNADNEAVIEADNSPVPAKLRAWLAAGAKVFADMAREEIDELVNAGVRKTFKGADVIDKATDALAESLISILGYAAPLEKRTAMLDQTFKQFSDHLCSELGANAAKGDNDMNAIKKALGLPDTATEAEIVAALAKRDADAAVLSLDLEILKAGMSDEEKSYHDGLKDDDAKKKFRSLSRAERAERMKKRDDLPEDVRKKLDEHDELKKRLAALEDGKALEGFKKQAIEAGLPEADGETLQKAYRGDKSAVDKIVDVVKALTAQVKAAGLFKEVGDRRTGGAVITAYDELVGKADELRKTETSLTKEQAFAKVYADPANAELVRRERGENRPQVAA